MSFTGTTRACVPAAVRTCVCVCVCMCVYMCVCMCMYYVCVCVCLCGTVSLECEREIIVCTERTLAFLCARERIVHVLHVHVLHVHVLHVHVQRVRLKKGRGGVAAGVSFVPCVSYCVARTLCAACKHACCAKRARNTVRARLIH